MRAFLLALATVLIVVAVALYQRTPWAAQQREQLFGPCGADVQLVPLESPGEAPVCQTTNGDTYEPTVDK